MLIIFIFCRSHFARYPRSARRPGDIGIFIGNAVAGRFNIMNSRQDAARSDVVAAGFGFAIEFAPGRDELFFFMG